MNWPIGRVLMSYFASMYVRIVTGFKIHDTTAGFKCYKRRVLETIELDKIRFKGYAFQIEMKYTAYKIGFKPSRGREQDERRYLRRGFLRRYAPAFRRYVKEVSEAT